jgi:hypothetical protein
MARSEEIPIPVERAHEIVDDAIVEIGSAVDDLRQALERGDVVPEPADEPTGQHSRDAETLGGNRRHQIGREGAMKSRSW